MLLRATRSKIENMGFINHFLPALQHIGAFGYAVVFLVSFLDSLIFIGTFVPGAIVVIFAGFLAAQGYLDIGYLVLFAAVGGIIGDGLSFHIGTRGKKLFRAGNKFLKLSHLEKSEQFFKKHGNKSVFLDRFVNPLRPTAAFVAGLSKMSRRSFIVWNVVGAFVWAVAYLLLGYFFGGALNTIEAWLTRAGIFIIGTVIAIICVGIIVKYSRPVFALLRSLALSIRDAVRANPDIRRFVGRHPAFFGFVRRRLNAGKFSGLPLTLLSLAFLYILTLFVGTVRDVIAAEPLVAADVRIANLLYDFRDVVLIKFFLWVTTLGTWQVVLCFATLSSALMWLWRKRYDILPLWVTLGGSYLFFALTKLVVHRPRPDVAYYVEQGFSFPSGHAAAAVALYGFLAYAIFRGQEGWRAKASAVFTSVVVTLGIGLSRLYLGVHYLSDVWGGYLLGLLWLIIGISIAEWLRRRSRKGKPAASRNARWASVVLPLAGLAVYAGYALQYHPQRNVLREPSPTTVETVGSAIAELPKYTETLLGTKQEPISFVLVAKSDETLLSDLEDAGWMLADKADPDSIVKLAKTALQNGSYPTAPMTPSFWNARVYDFGFEKPTEARSVRERHHARVWRTRFATPEGNVYVATASQDIGLKWLVTHKINPDIDKERELLFADLERAGVVGDAVKEKLVAPTLGTNFSGDRFFTDGEAYVLVLQ